MNSSAITIEGDRLAVNFERFALDDYDLFLRTKALPEQQVEFDPERETYRITAPARFARILGVDHEAVSRAALPLADHLFDYQRAITGYALDAKRYAIWADCGLGKTAMFLEWARHVVHRTGQKVLLLSPPAIIEQTREEARRFYGDSLEVPRLGSRESLAHWCKEPGAGLGICNYEKLIAGVMPELRHLGGLVLDESSVLKTGGGVIKWNLIKSAKGIEYKLSCTATPAPNDTMEYASQASFLEKLRDEGEILWTYFQRDKRGNWQVKPHARTAFYRFMAGWSIYLRNPAHYGWADNLADVPAPVVDQTTLPETQAQSVAASRLVHFDRGELLADKLGVTERSKLSQLAKGFLYGEKKQVTRYASMKPGEVAAQIKNDLAAGRQVLVWTVYDAEGDIIAENLPAGLSGVEILSGKTKDAERLAILERFRRGETRALISKAGLLGYGMNFQFCTSMIFSGFTDSFEQFYQATRRAYRYGSTEQLHIHIPYVPALEGHIWENVLRKQCRWEADTAEQEANYIQAMKGFYEAMQLRS